MINKKSTENVCMVTPSSNSNSRFFQIEYLTSSDVSPVTHAPLHLCCRIHCRLPSVQRSCNEMATLHNAPQVQRCTNTKEGASCIVKPTLVHRSDCIKELTSEAGGVKSENQPLITLESEYTPSMSCISDVHDEIMPLREGEERVQSELEFEQGKPSCVQFGELRQSLCKLEKSCKGGVCVSKKNESFPYSLDVAFLTICKEQRLIKSLDFLITPSVLDSQIELGSASDQPLKYVIAPKIDNFELKDPHNAHACTIHSARYTMPLFLYSCTFAPAVHCARLPFHCSFAAQMANDSEFDSKGVKVTCGAKVPYKRRRCKHLLLYSRSEFDSKGALQTSEVVHRRCKEDSAPKVVIATTCPVGAKKMHSRRQMQVQRKSIEIPQLLPFLFFDVGLRRGYKYINTIKTNYDLFKAQWVYKGCIDAQFNQSICTNNHKEGTEEVTIGSASLAYPQAGGTKKMHNRGYLVRTRTFSFATPIPAVTLRVHNGKVSAIKQPTINSISRSIVTTASCISDAPPGPSTSNFFSLTTKTNKIEKKRLQRLTQIAYYQSGKIVVQTLLPLHPPVALITLNLSGTTTATSADTYIPIDDESNTYWCSFLESRLIGLYGGKASSLLLNGKHLLSIFSEEPKSKDEISDALPSDRPYKDIRAPLHLDTEGVSRTVQGVNSRLSGLTTRFTRFAIDPVGSSKFYFTGGAKKQQQRYFDSCTEGARSERAETMHRSSLGAVQSSLHFRCTGKKLQRGNLFQSNIGTEEIQTATFLAVAMVNRWALSYSCTSDVSLPKVDCASSDCVPRGGKVAKVAPPNAQSGSLNLPYGENSDNSNGPYYQLGWGSKADYLHSISNDSEECYHSSLENNKPLLFTRATYFKQKNTGVAGTKEQLKLQKQRKSFESTLDLQETDCNISSYAQCTRVADISFAPTVHPSSETSNTCGAKVPTKRPSHRTENLRFSEASELTKKHLETLASAPTFVLHSMRKKPIALLSPMRELGCIGGVLDLGRKVTRMSGKSKKSVSSFTTSLISKADAKNCTYLNGGNSALLYSPGRLSIENVAITIPLRTHVFQLVNPLQFSISQRDRFYPGWFRLYLPDIEATEFMKNVANYYYSQGLQTLTRSSSIFDQTGAVDTENPIFLVSSFSKKNRIKKLPTKLGAVSASLLAPSVISDRKTRASLDKSFPSLPCSKRNTPTLRYIFPAPRQTNFETTSSCSKIPSALQKLPFDYNDVFFLEKELIYHSLVNNCFSKAFFLIDQNRQLTDYFADYLVRFQILRQHQILYLFSTVLFNCQKQT